MINWITKKINIKNIFSSRWEPSLLNLIKKQKKSSEELGGLLKINIRNFWISKAEMVLVVCLFFVFILLSHIQTIIQTLFKNEGIISATLSHYPFKGSLFLQSIDAHYSNLISVHTGIGAVLIALAFFIAQELTKDGGPYKGIILLRRSRFFTLLVAEILAFLLFIWGSVNIFVILPIIAIAIFTIISIFQTIKLITNNVGLKKAEDELLSKIIVGNFLKVLDKEITKRIATNTLVEKIKQHDDIIELNPFSPVHKELYFAIKTKTSGTIADIRLRKLKKLISFIGSKQVADNSLVDQEIETTKKNEYKDRLCQITPMPFSHTDYHSGNLFWVKNDVLDDKITKERIEKMVLDIFVIKKEDDIETEARNELVKLKIRSIEAIKNLRSEELEDLVAFYIKLVDNFYSMILLYGGGFSREQAEKERTNFIEKLKPMEWLSSDIREILEISIKSNDFEMIKTVAYLPFVFMRKAVDNKDHLVFQEFLYFSQILYARGYEMQKNGDLRTSELVLDRTWRYLKEFCDYHLEPKLENVEDYPIEDFKDFSIYLLKTFQYLLKATLDNQDLNNFKKFLSVVNRLFKNLNHNYYRKNKEKGQEVFDFIDGKRSEMIFGLASWILHLYFSNKENARIKEFLNEIKSALPQDIVKFTDIFLSVHDFKVEDFWGWDHWELSMHEEGEVHSIQILEKIERLYVVHALSLIRSKTQEELDQIKLPYNRDMAFLADGTRDLMKTIKNVEENPDNWSDLLDQNAISKTNGLKSLLEKAKENQEEDDLKKKRSTEINGDKVKSFKDKFIKNYSDSHPIKDIVRAYGIYEDKTKEEYSGSIKKLGINTMFDKSPFFGDEVSWHVHYVGLEEAFGFGRNMAYGENDYILKEIIKSSNEISRDDFYKKLNESDPQNVIVIATNHAVWKFFERSGGQYIPKWRQDYRVDIVDKKASGAIKISNFYIPVYEAYNSDAKKSDIIIVNKSTIGKCTQYSPLDKKDKAEMLINEFLVDIKEFTDDSEILNEFMQKQPPWLKEIEGDINKKNYLKERVLIHVFERFEFKTPDDFQGYVLHVDEKE